jgi:hypothetical protein
MALPGRGRELQNRFFAQAPGPRPLLSPRGRTRRLSLEGEAKRAIVVPILIQLTGVR